ncbi:MAG: hypothetical protein E6G01_11630 [Actinobacteria bacterium]|nr:MAG: hypothetical protein E6G01_11630 [Actinomycetota bacterium]
MSPLGPDRDQIGKVIRSRTTLPDRIWRRSAWTQYDPDEPRQHSTTVVPSAKRTRSVSARCPAPVEQTSWTGTAEVRNLAAASEARSLSWSNTSL